MALIKLNRRAYFIDCDNVKVTKVSNGRWEVEYDFDTDKPGRKFLVIGGVQSGGAYNEWFCHHPEFYGDTWVPKNSMIAAIKCGVAY